MRHLATLDESETVVAQRADGYGAYEVVGAVDAVLMVDEMPEEEAPDLTPEEALAADAEAYGFRREMKNEAMRRL